MARGKEVVAIVPAAIRDRHGDPTGAAGAEIEIHGAKTWPRTSEEDGRGEVVVDGLNVFLPKAAPVPGPKDKMRARDVIWDVEGVPAEYLGKGTLVVLKRVGT